MMILPREVKAEATAVSTEASGRSGAERKPTVALYSVDEYNITNVKRHQNVRKENGCLYGHGDAKLERMLSRSGRLTISKKCEYSRTSLST